MLPVCVSDKMKNYKAQKINVQNTKDKIIRYKRKFMKQIYETDLWNKR